MIVQCPHWGKPVPVNGLGRKPLIIPPKNVCEALQTHSSVVEAAKGLVGFSEGYIFKIPKAKWLRLGDAANLGKGVSHDKER